MIATLATLLSLAAASASPGAPVTTQQESTRAERVRALQGRTWEIQANRVQGRLQIDGLLDEPDWQQVPPISGFYQTERNEGLPGSEHTEIRALYDDTNLYVGIRADSHDPKGVKALALFRDEWSGDDMLLISIDAYHDHRSAMQFMTNANGYMVDSLQTGETTSSRNQDWNTVWDSRASLTARGWEAEVVIPFKSLRFNRPAPGEEVVFGIGFKRNLPRKNEENNWPFVSNDSSWYRPAELGHLRGLRDIQPGRNFELRPYVLGGATRQTERSTTDVRKAAGVDAKWGLTPGLTADFSLNTDFAQEEADIQQINFTRFSLFFPERRQFFLEGQRMFQFGLPSELDLIFSRRIGLTPDGRIIPIRAGGRLSSRRGRTSLGAMNIQTGPELGFPAENFTVLRVRKDLFSRSSVGAVFTNRQGGGRFNRVFGADATFLFRRVWLAEGFVARVDMPGKTAGTTAEYAKVAYDADRLGVAYRFLSIGQGFDPGVGFVRRPDSRENFGELRFSPRPDADWLRQVHFSGSLRHIENQRHVLETRERSGAMSFALESGDTIGLTYTNAFESLEAPFRLRSDVSIQPGDYRFDTLKTNVNTFRRRQARINVAFATGGFWDGDRRTVTVEPYYRVTKHFGLGGKYEVNWVDLPQRRFVSHLVSSRFEIAFGRDVILLPLLQYNADSKIFSANLRFHWIFKPGSDFFVVYNEFDESGRTYSRNRSLAVKMNYWLTF